MNSKIQIFNNPNFGEVRIATGESNEPLFCLADICKALDLTQVSRVKDRLDKDGVTQSKVIDSLGREQEALFITEKNLYRVIMRSDKPEAMQFQDWICDEVLPSIRKHGMYATEDVIDKAIQDPDFIIKVMTSLKEERQQRQLAESKATLFEQVTIEQAPKVIFADAVATSKRSCLIAELAKLLQQNGVNIGQNRLFEWLRGNDYLCRKGEYYNQPTQRAMQLGLFEIKKNAIPKPDGVVLTSTTTKVTGKGQIYFINKFCRQSQLI